MITLARDEWDFSSLTNRRKAKGAKYPKDELKTCAYYEYAREATHVRAAYIQARKPGKKGHVTFHKFSSLVDTDAFAALMPGFPTTPWLTETASMDSERKEKIIERCAPKMPALLEITPPHPFLDKATDKYSSRVVRDLGPWLFESVAFQICRNYADEEIVESFKNWLKAHSPEFEARRTQAINLSIRGGGARASRANQTQAFASREVVGAVCLHRSQTGDWQPSGVTDPVYGRHGGVEYLLAVGAFGLGGFLALAVLPFFFLPLSTYSTEWRMPTIPDAPFQATPYPFIGDDRPFYFIREGFLYGPRTDMEIALLRVSGWLTDDVLITCDDAERWLKMEEFMPLNAEAGTASGADAEEPKFDWISHGIRAYVGDPIAGAAIGMHAAKKALAWIAAVSNPDAPHQLSSGSMLEDGSKVNCARCAALILPATARRNGGVCFKCKPRRKLL